MPFARRALDEGRGLVLAVFLVLVGLSSCLGISSTLTTQQTLFDLQTRYTQIGGIALHYVSLPLCEVVGVAEPCAKARVVVAIQLVDQEVYNVLLAAEAARDTVDAALYIQLTQAALNRLRAVLARFAIEEALK